MKIIVIEEELDSMVCWAHVGMHFNGFDGAIGGGYIPLDSANALFSF